MSLARTRVPATGAVPASVCVSLSRPLRESVPGPRRAPEGLGAQQPEATRRVNRHDSGRRGRAPDALIALGLTDSRSQSQFVPVFDKVRFPVPLPIAFNVNGQGRSGTLTGRQANRATPFNTPHKHQISERLPFYTMYVPGARRLRTTQ